MATRMEVEQSRARAQAANGSRRKKRRKGRRTLHYVLLILFLLAAGAVLSMTVFFKVEEVVAVGTDKYAPNDIAAVSGIVEGDNLLRINKAEVEQKLMEQFPYIQAVEVRRKLPPKVELRITQAEPEGAIISGDEVVLIDRDGKVLERGNLLVPDSIPVVKGIGVTGVAPGQVLGEAAKGRLVMLQYLLDAMEESGFEDITNVDLSDELNMQIIYENRVILKLGTEADLAYKLRFAKSLLETLVKPEEKGVLDITEYARNRAVFSPRHDLQNSEDAAASLVTGEENKLIDEGGEQSAGQTGDEDMPASTPVGVE